MKRPRPMMLALAMGLWLSPGWAQDEACTQKCGDTMGSCMSGCSLDNRCSTSCSMKLNTCIARCNAKRKSPLGKKCVGANGKSIPCPNFTPPPPPKEIPPDPPEK